MSLWSERARQYGRRSAVGLPVADSDLGRVTNEQLGILMPLLQAESAGKQFECALDFGCGYGRFAPALGEIAGKVIAFDQYPDLFRFAPVCDATFISGKALDFLDNFAGSFDLIWIVHVLGGIGNDMLPSYVAGLTRALTPDGLLFMSDNIEAQERASGPWTVRTEQTYCDLFASAGVPLRAVGHYAALGNPMTVFAGKKV